MTTEETRMPGAQLISLTTDVVVELVKRIAELAPLNPEERIKLAKHILESAMKRLER